MAREVFVDTWGWYVLVDRRDPDHGRAASLVRDLIQSRVRLVSSDYVLDESCTLAKARAGSTAAIRLLSLVEGTAALDLEWVGSERFERAKGRFRKYRDQAFSFTDCTSFEIMRERGIEEAITNDDHFRIAGFQVLPSASME
jgi:predicted nucleic acid-binding protein